MSKVDENIYSNYLAMKDNMEKIAALAARLGALEKDTHAAFCNISDRLSALAHAIDLVEVVQNGHRLALDALELRMANTERTQGNVMVEGADRKRECMRLATRLDALEAAMKQYARVEEARQIAYDDLCAKHDALEQRHEGLVLTVSGLAKQEGDRLDALEKQTENQREGFVDRLDKLAERCTTRREWFDMTIADIGSCLENATQEHNALKQQFEEWAVTLNALGCASDRAEQERNALAKWVLELETEPKRAWHRLRHVEDRYNSNVVHVAEAIGTLEERVAALEKRLEATVSENYEHSKSLASARWARESLEKRVADLEASRTQHGELIFKLEREVEILEGEKEVPF